MFAEVTFEPRRSERANVRAVRVLLSLQYRSGPHVASLFGDTVQLQTRPYPPPNQPLTLVNPVRTAVLCFGGRNTFEPFQVEKKGSPAFGTNDSKSKVVLSPKRDHGCRDW